MPASVELEPSAHAPHFRSAGKIGAMMAVLSLVARRNENLDWLADKFFAVKAEELFGLGVDLQDGSCFVDRDNGIGNGLEQVVRQENLSEFVD